ncbi:exonuclease domain-containing protein [Singulisphaera sp. Ch08]|uniref:Exonuclease domain-containing protein n=1 Tax=Singulisphaera sp. Ch08 TaxID=3120278 RepID=A0AAU7CDK0_9BACT
MKSENPTRQYVAFDLETTGLVAETDRVVEIGAVRFDASGHELGRFECLVHPERPMSPAAQAIHGISDADLVGALPARDVLPQFLEYLGDPRTTLLLAHNAAFDAGFLGRELALIGRDASEYAVVDTLALARRMIPEARDHRLDTLARLFSLDPDGPHRALADSLRVKGLWLALNGATTPAEWLVSYPIIDARGGMPAPNGWDLLNEAIAQGLVIRMEYAGGSRGPAPRDVTPRGFAHRGGVAYLVALCHLDTYEKSFRLDRVTRYQVVPPSEMTTAPTAPEA